MVGSWRVFGGRVFRPFTQVDCLELWWPGPTILASLRVSVGLAESVHMVDMESICALRLP